MNRMKPKDTIKDRKAILSTLWVFYLINIIYADILNILGESGSTKALESEELINTLVSSEMLLVSAIFLEIAMVMIVLSRLLKYGINRWANIIIATLHTLGLLASLFVGALKIYYVFFVIVEIITLLYIVWYAWTWKPKDIIQINDD